MQKMGGGNGTKEIIELEDKLKAAEAKLKVGH